MGYSMTQTDQDSRIKARDKGAALAALAAHPRWAVEDAATFESVLAFHEWECKADSCSGDVAWLFYTGGKYLEDVQLLAVIAPWVEDGSYLHILGEDGHQWRWEFRSGVLYAVEGEWMASEAGRAVRVLTQDEATA